MQRRTTILDVAKLADVSKVTVSYVLNGHSRSARISEDTERRVLQAAQQLSYRPNNVARMLVKQRSQSLAVVFQYAELFSSGSGFINEVMRGVCSASVAEGYDLMLHTKLVTNPEMEADVLSDGRVDGALVLRDEDDPTIRALIECGMPTVLFFTRSEHPNAAWVDADNLTGGRLATEHLISLGHKRIAMVNGPAKSVAAGLRYQGYADALAAAGLEPFPEIARCGSSKEVDECLPPMLLRADRPTALFVWSDDVALACLDVARSLGISVPGQLSIVGFDSLEAGARSMPALTSVRQPVFDMAFKAASLLASICRDENPAQRRILYPLSLDVRGSSAPIDHI